MDGLAETSDWEGSVCGCVQQLCSGSGAAKGAVAQTLWMGRESGRSARGMTPRRVAQLHASGSDMPLTATGILEARVFPVGEVFIGGRRVAAAHI